MCSQSLCHPFFRIDFIMAPNHVPQIAKKLMVNAKQNFDRSVHMQRLMRIGAEPSAGVAVQITVAVTGDCVVGVPNLRQGSECSVCRTLVWSFNGSSQRDGARAGHERRARELRRCTLRCVAFSGPPRKETHGESWCC